CSLTPVCFCLVYFFFTFVPYTPRLRSFPTRRSSDLGRIAMDEMPAAVVGHHATQSAVDRLVPAGGCEQRMRKPCRFGCRHILALDRKSTRLNSSHVKHSYAVFCLKKKIHSPALKKI